MIHAQIIRYFAVFFNPMAWQKNKLPAANPPTRNKLHLILKKLAVDL
jgi:hypothetical protein